jgi:hypothetical protein
VKPVVTSTTRFLRSALRPLPGLLNDSYGALASVAGILGLTFLAKLVGSTTFAVAVISGYVIVLLTIAGARLELERLRQQVVALSLDQLRPAILRDGHNPIVQYSVRVRNEGPSSHFTARVNSEVHGWDPHLPSYGHFSLPWEGVSTDVAPLTTDTARDVHVLRYYVDGNVVRFRVPPGADRANWELGDGVPMSVTRGIDLTFELRVWDEDRDAGQAWQIVFSYPPREPNEPNPTLPELRAVAI